MSYERMTKVISDADGNEFVTCIHYGTERCRIHSEKIEGCSSCPMISAIFNQLCEFEEIFCEGRESTT